MSHCVLDTTIMQKSNAPIENTPRGGRTIAKRLRLLQRIANGELILLWSERLVHEWNDHVPEPRNDFVRAILELVTTGHGRYNWSARWTGAMREALRQCRFPAHDNHLIRTALLDDGGSFLVTEDGPALNAAACVKRHFGVGVVHTDGAAAIPDS